LINTSRFIGFFSAPFSPSKYTAGKGGNVWSLSRVWKENVNVKLINDKSFISVELDRNYYLDLVAWPTYTCFMDHFLQFCHVDTPKVVFLMGLTIVY
jgi:hypothetical protein